MSKNLSKIPVTEPVEVTGILMSYCPESMLLHDTERPGLPFLVIAESADLGGAVGEIVHDRPLRVAREFLWILLL